MTTQTIDFSEIDLTGGLRWNGEVIGAAHYNGERLWPFGVDLLYTGGIGGASYLPDAGAVFADTAAATPATFGGSIARTNPAGGAGNALQASASLRPLLGRAPKRGDVNLATDTDTATGASNGTLQSAGTVAFNGAEIPVQEFTAGTVTNLTAIGIFKSGIPMPGEQNRTFSALVQPRGNRYIYANAYVAINVGCVLRVDTQDGASSIVAMNNVSANNATGKAVHLGAGVWRVTVSFRKTAAQTSAFFGVFCTGELRSAFSSGYLFRNFTEQPTDAFTAGGWMAEDRGDATLNPDPTNYQRVGLFGDVTEAGVPSYPFVRFDLSDDALVTTLPQAVTGDVVIAGRNGSVIAPHSYVAGSTFQLGPTSHTGGTPGILRAIGDVVGWSILGKTLTAAERERLMRFYKRRGAKGLLVTGTGLELVTNGGFDTDTDWTKGTGWTIAGGVATKAAGTAAGLDQAETLIAGAAYLLTYTVTRSAGTLTPQFIGGTTQGGVSVNASGTYTQVMVAVTGNATLRFQADAAFAGTLDAVSLRRIRPEEDW